MAEVSGIRINGRYITDFIQKSDGVYSSSTDKYRTNGSNMSFARYHSSWTPFNPILPFVQYFKQPSATNNAGFIMRGFAPTYVNRVSHTGGGAFLIQFRGTGNPYDNGYIRIYKDGNLILGETSCPSVISMVIQGAGGGGAGGGGWWTGKSSYGGGSGSAMVLSIEMPYYSTDWRNVVQVNMGWGGGGGSAWNYGGAGGASDVFLNVNGSWVQVASVHGGYGGPCEGAGWNWGSGHSSSNVYQGIDYSVYGVEGWGRITITPYNRYYYYSSGNVPYVRGNYGRGMFDMSLGKVVGSSSGGYPQTNYSYWGSDTWASKSSAFATNYWYPGNSSLFSIGGVVNYSDKSGQSGSWGSGGAAGGSANNGFDSGINSGASGGSAGIKLYW